MAMVNQFVAELARAVSQPRLERYRPPTGGTDLEMVTRYFWNMALADALLCPIGTVEIMLRNTIHNALSSHFGMANWYDGHGFLEDRQIAQLEEAKGSIAARNKPVTPERVISALTFGFWVTLLSRNYHDRFWRANKSANLRAAFPNVPKQKRQRSDIQAKYYRVLQLRNLAFHHEPIFDRPTLLDDYRRAYDAIEWINPDMVAKTRLFDRFPDEYSDDGARIRAKLKAYLGIP
jgi:hypothetical protein